MRYVVLSPSITIDFVMVVSQAQNRPQEDTTDGNTEQSGEDIDQGEADDSTESLAPPSPPPGPSAATVAYNFVTSFFTSLFPSGPGVQN